MTTTHPASPKQQSYIESLLAKHDTSGTAYEGWTPDWSRATSAAASAVIDYLKTLPLVADQKWDAMTTINTSHGTGEPEAGVYEGTDARLFRVYLGQQSGKMLVKEIIVDEDGVGYAYLGAAARHLPQTARRLSLEEVGAMGKTFDHCLCCGRRLDDPESVDRGIGPVCAKKY